MFEKEFAFLVLAFAIIAISIYFSLAQYDECKAKNGVMVKGISWTGYVCLERAK